MADIAIKEEVETVKYIVFDPNAITKKALLNASPEVRIVASTLTFSLNLLIRGTDRIVINGLLAIIRPTTYPLTLNCLAVSGKKIGIIKLPKTCQPTLMQKILMILDAIDF